MLKRRRHFAYKTVFCLLLAATLALPSFWHAHAQQAAPPATTPAAAAAPAMAQAASPAPQTPVPPATATPAPPPAAAVLPAPAIQPPPVAPVIQVGIAGMVRNSDPIVQAVMAFLLLCSVLSWAAFIYKSVILVAARRNTLAFADAFRGASTMENAAAALGRTGHGAAAAMWQAAKQEWDLTLRLTGSTLAPDQTNRLLQRLVLAMGSAQEQALSRLGNYMGLLATIGSTAPFIGLFGTVWGILDSFEHISASYNTSLSVVAPGIAEALLATAFGLFAAIPATMFYNRFAREIGKLTGLLDNLTAELVVFASRDVERLHK